MFRKLLRSKQELSIEDSRSILKENKTGILGVNGDDGYPYTIPINYVFYNEKIYLHCSKIGYKVDSIRKSNKVSFCVIGKDEPVNETYSNKYKSVIVFGRAKEIFELTKIEEVLKELNKSIFNDTSLKSNKVIENSLKNVNIIEITVEYMSGKQSKYLLNDKN